MQVRLMSRIHTGDNGNDNIVYQDLPMVDNVDRLL